MKISDHFRSIHTIGARLAESDGGFSGWAVCTWCHLICNRVSLHNIIQNVHRDVRRVQIMDSTPPPESLPNLAFQQEVGDFLDRLYHAVLGGRSAVDASRELMDEQCYHWTADLHRDLEHAATVLAAAWNNPGDVISPKWLL